MSAGGARSKRRGADGKELLAWVNWKLRPGRVERLEEIGIDKIEVLLNRLEKTTSPSLPPCPPKNRLEAIMRAGIIIDRVKKRSQVAGGSRRVHLGPEDLLETKGVAALVFLLVLLFLLPDDDDHHHHINNNNGPTPTPPKARLLQWLLLLIEPYALPLSSFRPSPLLWGYVVAAVIHFHAPHLIDFFALPPYSPDMTSADSPPVVASLVLDILSQRWALPPLISAVDLHQGNFSEEALVTFMAAVRGELRNPPSGDDLLPTDSLPSSQQQDPDRVLLKAVMDAAMQSNRQALDSSLAAVVERVRDATSSSANVLSASPVDLIQVPLRDLLVDAVKLCQVPTDDLRFRLARRDCMLLMVGLRRLPAAAPHLHRQDVLSSSSSSSSSSPPLSEARVAVLSQVMDADQFAGLKLLQEDLAALAQSSAKSDVRKRRQIARELGLAERGSCPASQILRAAAEQQSRSMAEEGLVALRNLVPRSRGDRGRQLILAACDALNDALDGQTPDFCDAAQEAARLAQDMEQSSNVIRAVDATSRIITASRRGNLALVRENSQVLEAESRAAVANAEGKRAVAVDPVRVDSFIRDLLILTPAHLEAVESQHFERARTTAVDIASLIEDLEDSTRNVQGDLAELEAMASTLGDLSLDSQLFLHSETRLLAHEVSGMGKENAAAVINLDTSGGPNEFREATRAVVPKLALAAVRKEKEDAVRRREGLADAVTRLGRYGRGLGEENEKTVHLREEARERALEEAARIRRTRVVQDDSLVEQRVWIGAAENLETLDDGGNSSSAPLDFLDELEALELGVEKLTLAEELGFSLTAGDLSDCLMALSDPHSLEDCPIVLPDQETLYERHVASWATEPLLAPLEAPSSLVDDLEALDFGVDRMSELETMAVQLESLQSSPSTVSQEQTFCPPEVAAAAVRAILDASDVEEQVLYSMDLILKVRGDPTRLSQVRRISVILLRKAAELTLVEEEDDEVRRGEVRHSVNLLSERLAQLLLDCVPPNEQTYTTLSIGKKLLQSVTELSKGSLASFQDEPAPNGLSGSLHALPLYLGKVEELLLDGGPSKELQRASVYFMNVLKHLASAFVRGDKRLLGRLVEKSKAWVAQLIQGMKAKEEGKAWPAKKLEETSADLLRLVGDELVVCCSHCGLVLSGAITTVEGRSFHMKCYS